MLNRIAACLKFIRKSQNVITRQKIVIIFNELLRFYRTELLYQSTKFTKRTVSENTHTSFFYLYLFFIFLYFFVPTYQASVPILLKNSIDTLLTNIGFEGFSDSTIKFIILTVTSSLGFILSLLSAIYVFTHREQKSIAPSASNGTKKNVLLVINISLVLLAMLLGYTLSANIDALILQKEPDMHNLHITKFLFPKICIWIFVIILLITFTIELIKYLFKSMSIDKMTRSSISDVSSNIDSLVSIDDKHRKVDTLLMNQYRQTHYNIESIFQNLRFVGDNNMNKEFDENIETLALVLGKFRQGNKRYSIENISSFLLERDGVLFIEVYNSLLRNMLSLTIHLYKNNHFKKGKKLTTLYYAQFINTEENLKSNFILSLNEFLDSIDTSNERYFRDFLVGLRTLPEESTLVIYKNLILKLILKKNLESLTSVVAEFKKHVIDDKKVYGDTSNNSFLKAISNKQNSVLKNNAIVILLQCLIKSIEVSQYGTTGFIIKYIVTNFSGEELTEAYKTLKNNPLTFTKILENSEKKLSSSLYSDEEEIGLVGINDGTFDYCCKKMCILLYGQQSLALKEKLWFNFAGKIIDLKEEFYNCTYSQYVIKKINAASNSYGLIFFNDTDIMKNIYENLGITNIDELQTKNS